MFELGAVVIAIAVIVPFVTFFSPQWWFDLLFPDSMEAIGLIRFMAEDPDMNLLSNIYGDKTTNLLTTWGILGIIYAEDGSKYEYNITEKGKKFVEKYKNSKYGLRLFVIGKLGQRLLKFTLPFIGANILFVWYKYFENYLEKLFDMCP